MTPAEQHQLLLHAVLECDKAQLPDRWELGVCEYGGDGEHPPGVQIDVLAHPLDQGRFHTVPWEHVADWDFQAEITLMVMEINLGNTLDA